VIEVVSPGSSLLIRAIRHGVALLQFCLTCLGDEDAMQNDDSADAYNGAAPGAGDGGGGGETSTTISLTDMIAELRRELRYRQINYPSLIKRGALTEAAAERQKARLQALGVLVSLEEIDADPEYPERVTPEALAGV
jgi:hypothetical protein